VKKVLAIVASKRRLGNCEIMVKEIGRRIAVPHQLQLLRLPDFHLDYCTGCFRCLAEKRCVLKDDLAQVLEAICAADALILAAPTYILGAPACLKSFLDRGIAFYGVAERLWGKPAVGVGIAGRVGKEGSTLLDIERFLAVIQAQNRMSRIVYGALPGEVLLDDGNRETAAALAAALFGPAPAREEAACSACGGKTFRFLEGNRVRCMLCSSSGTLVARDGRIVPVIDADEHQFLVGKTEALGHREMLGDIRERFEAQKGRLKQIVAAYAEEGDWVRPEKRS
jgi:multimeric flavodoxin WrbA